MRIVVQRSGPARVEVDGRVTGEIASGLVLLVGVGRGDTEDDADYLADKVAHLRIFADEDGKMGRDITEVGGSVLSVSQFTLYGDVRKGRRPSYAQAAEPEEANRLYEYFNERLRAVGLSVQTGVFRAMMDVHLVNDGPVTILLDSAKNF
ncbi:D-aminoacyl-tRNA deacylase [Alicyclobacillus fastidiosus]|uniref:D-aminoacyl-tRNA deacylase n=1 Tax=Alicyclobacillus fastidiosus TaxID=392011 RepID=A0ABY6ZLA4_9BACL|nr:D-aminoacyl-tRNA deacylase [Alicyclobacillus fastidiosus]WAH43651.1 D-aminoacyl-tRNA deacylase [Alicyclobacillus fastidiosus]GMA59850.1 D-aminoacyl-tRNA deacylase [Alicyclobacillus fastidiosus]